MTPETASLLDKAERSIRATEVLVHDVGAEFAASRAYYAMFYVAEAILNEHGLRLRKHAAVHAAFGARFAKTALLDPKFHRWLLDAFDRRVVSDYSIEATITAVEVEATIEQAREFLGVARSFLSEGAR